MAGGLTGTEPRGELFSSESWAEWGTLGGGGEGGEGNGGIVGPQWAAATAWKVYVPARQWSSKKTVVMDIRAQT